MVGAARKGARIVKHRAMFGKFWKIWAERSDSGYGESREGRGGLTPVRHVGDQKRGVTVMRWMSAISFSSVSDFDAPMEGAGRT
jgi:hypothetical protein